MWKVVVLIMKMDFSGKNGYSCQAFHKVLNIVWSEMVTRKLQTYIISYDLMEMQKKVSTDKLDIKEINK